MEALNAGESGEILSVLDGFDNVTVRAVRDAIINDRFDDWDANRWRGGNGFDLNGVDGLITSLEAITW
jgi:hypothetical protein